MRQLPTLHGLDRITALEGDTVSAFEIVDGPQQGRTVVELLNAHQNVIARTVAEPLGSRESTADAVLAQSPLERCADFALAPFKGRKRVAAMVTLRVSSTTATLESLRQQVGSVERSA